MIRVKKTVLILILIAAVLLSPAAFYDTTPTNAAAAAHVAGEVLAELEDNAYTSVIVILRDQADTESINAPTEREKRETMVGVLQETARASKEELQPFLEKETERGNIKEYRPFWIVNAFAAVINEEALQKLQERPQVEQIVPDRPFAVPAPTGSAAVGGERPAAEKAWNMVLINAPPVWEEDIYGRGIVVAIMDTGLDLEHPDLKNSYRGYLPGHGHDTSWFDASAYNNPGEGSQGPGDRNGHGTHIAGIIAGGTPTNPLGAAPAARLVPVNIFSRGYAWDSHITEAFQWLLAPGGDPDNAPDVINCSWASRPEYVTDYLQWEILHKLEQAGIFVAFAAGNNGTAGLGSPASYPHAFSVGALSREGGNVKAAAFSSRGPVTWQGVQYTKPDLTAPGTGVRSAWLNGGYASLDGTSIATAHVSGAAALLLEAMPGLSPAELRRILRHSAGWDPSWGQESGPPNNTYGYGLLDVYSALNYKNEIVRAETETLFQDGAEEGMLRWTTSEESPWETGGEKVYRGRQAFADSPWGEYEDGSHSWMALKEPILLCGYHTPVLSFQHFYELQRGIKEDDYGYVEISPDGENWVHLYRFSGTNKQFEKFTLPLNLPHDEEGLYIRFRLESSNNGPGRGWYIDDISVSASPLPLSALKELHITPAKTILGLDESIDINCEAIFCTRLTREIEPELLEWSSSDPQVAEVYNGTVTGISPGSAVISGKYAGHSAKFEIDVIEIELPVIDPAPGLYADSVTITLKNAPPGSRSYYTLDGSEPDDKSSPFTSPIILDRPADLKVRTYLDGIPGPVMEFSYDIREGASVKGTLKLQGRHEIDNQTEAFFICTEEGIVHEISFGSEKGDFEHLLPFGSYKLVVRRPQYLTRVVHFELAGSHTMEPLTLYCGDIDNNNVIDVSDLALLSLAFGSRPGSKNWNPLADLNDDGMVDVLDLSLLTQNYGLQGDSYK